jgi:hypothetical protein
LTGRKRTRLRWKDVISHPAYNIFFAPTCDSLHSFGQFFGQKHTLSAVHTTLCYVRLEYVGDVTQLSLLFSTCN